MPTTIPFEIFQLVCWSAISIACAFGAYYVRNVAKTIEDIRKDMKDDRDLLISHIQNSTAHCKYPGGLPNGQHN